MGLFGGSILINGNTFIMSGLFNNNTANYSGGALYINSSSGLTLLNTNTIKNRTIHGNRCGVCNIENNNKEQLPLVSCMGLYNINFANAITTNKYGIELNDTSKASKFDSAYVLPLFVDKGSVGQTGRGALNDPTNTAKILPYAGRNQTYILSGYYGEFLKKSSLASNSSHDTSTHGDIHTQLCPKSYCCSSPILYDGITLGCLFESLNKTGQIEHLLGGKDTFKCLPGDSETNSKAGQCLKCSGLLAAIILPNIVGFMLILFYTKKGLSPHRIDHPFIVYTTQSALYVFQLLPYLTFQAIVEIIAPIAQFFSLSVDMFSGNAAQCVLSNVDGRTKGSLNGIQIFIVHLGIKLYKSYKFKKELESQSNGEHEDAIKIKITSNTQGIIKNDKWDHELTHTIWNTVLIIYAQITATLERLIDCPDKTIMFYEGSIVCWYWIHIIYFLFPFIFIFILFSMRTLFGMGYLHRAYASLTLNYRNVCWWFASFSLFRRCIIIFSSLPAKRSDVTSTFLEVIIDCIFAFHFLLQPFHWITYVWFITISIPMTPYTFRAFLDEPGMNGVITIHLYIEKTSLEDGSEQLGRLHNTDAFAEHIVQHNLIAQRITAKHLQTTHVYDWPILFEKALHNIWDEYEKRSNMSLQRPKDYINFEEYILDNNNENKLIKISRKPRLNNVAMVVWKVTMKTPEFKQGREIIIVSNV